MKKNILLPVLAVLLMLPLTAWADHAGSLPFVFTSMKGDGNSYYYTNGIRKYLQTRTATAAMAQQDITLPVSLYNQTVWPAVETTVQLDSEGEEMPAYELQGWQTYKGMSRQGKVYYVPSAVDDRIILVLKDVNSGYVQLPYLIDNKTNKQLIIHLRGTVTLKCQGTAIRSEGPVSIYGEEAEDGAEPVNRFVLQGGRRGHAALETKGDVYVQDVCLDMADNQAPYAFLCSYSGEKEEHALELNHVQGKVKATKQTVMGFQSVTGAQGTSVEGLAITPGIEEEAASEEAEEDSTSERTFP